MQQDIRSTPLYLEAETMIQSLRRPGSGIMYDMREINTSSDGLKIVFSGIYTDKAEGKPTSRICLTGVNDTSVRVMTFGPNTDREPKFSPDGSVVAFLSDRNKAGDFQLYFLDPITGETTSGPLIQGWVEYLHWSPKGDQILLGVAGYGSDVSGGQGAVTSNKERTVSESWMPEVSSGDESYHWRSVWIYDVKTNQVTQASQPGLNIWEAVWCGSQAFAAVVSSLPSEGAWYASTLNVINLKTGESRLVYSPKDQLGWPSGSLSGNRIAVVEAVCSDRWLVAGDLLIIDLITGDISHIDTSGVDITHTEWRSEDRLFLGGHRGFDSVILEYDLQDSNLNEYWASSKISVGGRYIKPIPWGVGRGDCLLAVESFVLAPEIGLVQGGDYRKLLSTDCDMATEVLQWIGSVEAISWNAPDGLEVHGWLIQPKGEAPHPLVMHIHGGPVFQWRPRWWRGSPHLLMLLKRGYAIFEPNPRGSSGRGQEYARKEVGDPGGAETHDHLSGLDFLCAKGIVDASRIGVTGGSHGGYMTSWLITQDDRFAAAIPCSPVCNWYSQHLTSNIPEFCSLFLDDKLTRAGGKYFERSPIMHAHKVKTPTLNICGALDRCTPPEEAMQFHNALLENGVKSVLVTYPEEGHGVSKMPTAIDYAARVVSWFEEHMPS